MNPAMRWIFGVMVVVFSPCLFAQSAGERLATSEETALVMKAARSELKDPDSARITDLVVIPSKDKGSAFCGFLNAKNSFGGYTGGQLFGGRFLPAPSGKLLFAVILGMDDSDSTAGSIACKKLGFGK